MYIKKVDNRPSKSGIFASRSSLSSHLSGSIQDMSPSSASLLRNESYTSKRDYGSNVPASCGCKMHACYCRKIPGQSHKPYVLPRSESDISSAANNINGHKNMSSEEESTKQSFFDVLPYYLPCSAWLPNYNISKCVGDFIAGLSLASFQIPLALSYATSVAHVEPLCGLYSLAITPFIYAILGSVPQMIVGPESAISLVVGQTVEKMISHNPDLHATQLSAVITFISGGFLFLFGICRLGFLGNVLSRALLRGFISSVGLVMIVNSLISELKLDQILKHSPVHYHTPYQKVLFLVKYAPGNYHAPTAILSLSCFFILMMTKTIKKKLMSRFKWVVLLPDILLLIIGTIILSIKYRLKHDHGISTVGDFNTKGLDKVFNPLSTENRELIPQLLSPGFIVAMLGFFESTTASKSLANVVVSSNRELIALGSMNLVSSLLGSLPSFGGYGRSKVNAFSGAQTTMSGAFMGLLVFFTIRFLLPIIHHIPVCVLSVLTTVVGISLLEEAPPDLKFHLRCLGYNELLVFALTVLTTIFYSVEMGICIGCAYSVISIIKHSAKSRIQILARVRGTSRFVNSDNYLRHANGTHANLNLEKLAGSLVVKIPEPLTFTNTEDLKERLNRLEKYGSTRAHPGTRAGPQRSRTRHLIIDLNGLTYMDSSAAQILLEIVSSYRKRGVRIFLARITTQSMIRERLERSGVADLVESNILTTDDGHQVTTSPYFDTIEDALDIIETLETTDCSEPVCDDLSVISSTGVV